MTQLSLAHALPEPLTDGQMIRQYERAAEWFGSDANGLWLVEQGAFSIAALPARLRAAQAADGGAAA